MSKQLRLILIMAIITLFSFVGCGKWNKDEELTLACLLSETRQHKCLHSLIFNFDGSFKNHIKILRIP